MSRDTDRNFNDRKLNDGEMPMKRIASSLALAGLLAIVGGCTGLIDDPFGATPGAVGSPGSPGLGPNDDGPIVCEGTPVPGANALRRLTPIEYENTVADLFPGVRLPTLSLTRDGAESDHGRFENDVDGQAVSALKTEEFQQAAGSVAEAATGSLAMWAPCTTNDAACAAQITEHVAARIQRRPLSAEDRDALVAFVETSRADFGLDGSIGMLIEGLLQSPQFLYRTEFGRVDGAPEGLAQLDGHEVASRISYFLWRTMPDDELLAAAAEGVLDTPEGIEAQARRLLADPRATETLNDLYSQWFQLDRLARLSVESDLFPDWDPQLRADIRASTELTFQEAVSQGSGGIDSLFRGRFAYVNDRLAPIFGVEPPGTNELVRVELDPSQRAGILTHPGFLATRSKPTVHSPIARGVFVLDHVLCSPLPPPPPNADTMSTPLPEGEVVTTRERVDRSHSGACATCHDRIDGVGFAFENYDALGAFRTEEFGLPVDASTELTDMGEMSGSVSGGVEFAERVAQSREVRECVATHYLRYALGRSDNRRDRCQVDELATALEASNGDLNELAVALMTSPSFRYRLTVAE